MAVAAPAVKTARSTNPDRTNPEATTSSATLDRRARPAASNSLNDRIVAAANSPTATVGGAL